MILQIRKRARRRSILILGILTALAAICIVLCFGDLVTLINGPELLNKENFVSAESYNGNYVEVKDSIICAEFATETRVSSRTPFRKVYRYYLCRDNASKEEEPIFFAIRSSGKDSFRSKIPVISEKMLSYAPSYSPSGTLHKLNTEAASYFNLVLSKIGEFENTYQSVPYYIDNGYLGSTPILYPVAIAVIALVFLAAALLVLIRYLRMSYLSDLIQEIYQNPKEELENLESEFNEAKIFGENIRVSKKHIFCQARMKERIIPLNFIKKVILPEDREKGEVKIKLVLKDGKNFNLSIPEETSKDMVASLPINEQ